jgi:uncharacterized protein (TIGR02452 family)
MHAAQRRRPQPDSTDWAILSTDVPVFRDDEGTALDTPWTLSILAYAAPYAAALGQPRAGDQLEARIRRVLAIARAYGCTALVLGAWGCGAFCNDPVRIARDFKTALGEHAGGFAEVVFVIADRSPEGRYVAPFRAVLAGDARRGDSQDQRWAHDCYGSRQLSGLLACIAKKGATPDQPARPHVHRSDFG